MNRQIINNAKTYLQNSIKYIVKVYESIEIDNQYDSFLNMCDNHLNLCNFYANKFKREIIGLKLYRNYKLYKDYINFAQYTINVLQEKINDYREAIAEVVKEQEFYDNTRKRIETEYVINDNLNTDKINKLHNNTIKVTGFLQNKKRKYTKKKQ